MERRAREGSSAATRIAGRTMRASRTAQASEGGGCTRPSSALAPAPGTLRIVETEGATGDESVAELLQLVLRKMDRLEQLFAFVPLLIAQTGRCTSHLTVE